MATEQKADLGKVLHVTKEDQYRTVDELLQRGQSSQTFYTLLVLSTTIITAGLLLNNSAIVIGGMLVTPLLSPLLLIALGVEVGEIKVVKDALWLIMKSFFIVVLISFLMAFLLAQPTDLFRFENTIQAAALYFIVAMAAGMAATFGWARKGIADVLPGIAIAVSLVPPLSLIGVWLSVLRIDLVRVYLSIFLFNLIGIVVGSLIVFSLLKFYRTQKKVQIEIKEAEKLKKKEAEEKTEKKEKLEK